jgi:hypothetical protein
MMSKPPIAKTPAGGEFKTSGAGAGAASTMPDPFASPQFDCASLIALLALLVRLE